MARRPTHKNFLKWPEYVGSTDGCLWANVVQNCVQGGIVGEELCNATSKMGHRDNGQGRSPRRRPGCLWEVHEL
jgi:hypothetical protein